MAEKRRRPLLSSLPVTTSRQAAAEHALDAIDTDDLGFGLWLPLTHEDSIRLFTLTRDPASGLLAFSLSEHRLSDSPDYLAVSYAWGKIGNVAIIEASNGHRALRRNLHAALHNLHLRMQRGELDASTKFWVDALCINQESLEEKSQQVQQIGQTFRQAKMVLVWLGTHQDGGRSCLDPIFGDVALRPRWGRLSTHNYWTRAWIIQEFVLASDIVLMDELHWISGSRLLDRLDNVPSDNDIQRGSDSNAFATGSYDASLMGRIAYMRYRRLLYGDLEVKTMSSIVGRFREQLCSDIRDKVYALQSLSHYRNISVDYTITVGDLFWVTIFHSSTFYPTLGQIQQVMQALGLLPCQLLLLSHLLSFRHQQHDESPNIRPVCQEKINRFVRISLERDEIQGVRIARDLMTLRTSCDAGNRFSNSQHEEYLLINGQFESKDIIFQPRGLPFALILETAGSRVEKPVCGFAVRCSEHNLFVDDLLKTTAITRFRFPLRVWRFENHNELGIHTYDFSLLLIMNEEISKQDHSCISLGIGNEVWELEWKHYDMIMNSQSQALDTGYG